MFCLLGVFNGALSAGKALMGKYESSHSFVLMGLCLLAILNNTYVKNESSHSCVFNDT